MANGVPVEDVVEQLQLQLQMVQSRLRSDAASVAGHVFESYEDTFQWVVDNCSPEDWQYVMDMPALYSVVRPNGQEYDVMLTEESNSSKAGYASSAQARLSLSLTAQPGMDTPFLQFLNTASGNPLVSKEGSGTKWRRE
jgi:hypothetical protein